MLRLGGKLIMNLLKPTKSQCQLVIRFPSEGNHSDDQMAECELTLSKLLHCGEVDLREAGGDVVSLFILTTEPEECVREALGHLFSMNLRPVTAGYRSSREQEFVRLWPEDDSRVIGLQ